MEGKITCKNCKEKNDNDQVHHIYPCGHSLCSVCLNDMSGKENKCKSCLCFIDNIKINTLSEAVRALEIEEQKLAALCPQNSSNENKLDANKRTYFTLVGTQGDPVIEMTCYKFSKGTKEKESYYLSSRETEGERTERNEATSDYQRLAEEKDIRDKKVTTEDVKESTLISNVNPSSSHVDYEIKEDRELEFLESGTNGGSCPIHEHPNIGYCVTCCVMVCEECLITLHNNTSGISKCEIYSVYQMTEKFITECKEYADEDIELTKDLKLNMTAITLYLQKENHLISEKIRKIKDELRCLEKSLEKNNTLRSEVQNKEDHLAEWITAIQFYKRTLSKLHLSSTSASDMKEIVKNRDGIQEHLTEHTVFVEEFKQKHPQFYFDVVHLTDFDTKNKGNCDGSNTDDIVIILNDDKSEPDIKQQFSSLLSSHDSSQSSFNICTAVERDDQNASNSTAGELVKNKHGKSLTQILGFFPDMSATSTPLPETFETVNKGNASKETAYFSNTTDSQKSEDLLSYTDTNQIGVFYKQEQSTICRSENKSENKTETESSSKHLADTLTHVSDTSLAEGFKSLATDVPPVEIILESEEFEIMLNLSSNPSVQEVVQSSPKESRQEASKTNRNVNLPGSNPALNPKTSKRKSKKKKSKTKSQSKNKMDVSGTDPNQITKNEKTKLAKYGSNPIGENSQIEDETNAEASVRMHDYSVLEPHFSIPRAKLLDATQNQSSPSDLDLKALDSKDNQGFEKQSGKNQSLQECRDTSSKKFLPTSLKNTDMKKLTSSQDSNAETVRNLQQAIVTLTSSPASEKQSTSKIKDDANLDMLGKVMEICLDFTAHQPDISESVQHNQDPSKQNPSRSTHHSSHESLSHRETTDTPNSDNEGVIPKSTNTGATLEESNDNPKTPTSSSVSSELFSMGLFSKPLMTSEVVNRNTFDSVQYSASSPTKSLTRNISEESCKMHTSSSKPTVISVEPSSEMMKNFLLQCLTDAMSKTRGYFKYIEEITSFERELLAEGGFHVKSETSEDDSLLDLENSSKSQSPLRQSMAPDNAKKSTNELLKEIALQICRVLNVASTEVSTKGLSYVIISDPNKVKHMVPDNIIEVMPENRVQHFPSALLMDKETYVVFQSHADQAANKARKQATKIAKAGSLDESSIESIAQALITVASKKSRIAASTSQLSKTETDKKRDRREKCRRLRKKLVQRSHEKLQDYN